MPVLGYHSLIEKLPCSPEQKIRLRQYQPYYYSITLPLLGLMLLYGIAMLTLNLLVDTDSIAQELQVHIEAKTGRQWNTSKEIEISFLPSPKIVIHRVQLTNDYRAEDSNFMTAKRLELDVSWSEVMRAMPNPHTLRLVGADVSLETYGDGGDNWSSLEGILRDRASDSDVVVHLSNSRVYYQNQKTGKELDFVPLEGSVTLSDKVEVNARAKLDNTMLEMKAHCSIGVAQYPKPFESDCHIEHKEGKNRFSFDGSLAMDEKKNVALEGKVGIEAKHLMPSIKRWLWNDVTYGAEDTPLNLSLNGVMRMAPSLLELDASNIASEKTRGKGSLKYKASGSNSVPDDMSMEFEFKELHLDDFTGLTAGLVEQFSGKANEGLGRAAGVEGVVNLDIQTILLNGTQAATNLLIRSAWNGRTLDVSKLTANLTGGSVSASGYVYGGANSLQTNMSYDLHGKDLKNTLSAMTVALPETGIDYSANYHSKGQVILRQDALLISKSELTLGEMEVKGGINYLFAQKDESPAIEAGLAISKLPLSRMISAWQQGTSIYDYPSNLKAYNPYAFEWLVDPALRITGQFALNDFAHEVAEKSSAAFRLSLKPEAFEITRLKSTLDDNRVSGSLLVSRDKNMIKPKLTSSLNVARLDLGRLAPYFYASESGLQAANSGTWSRKHLSLLPLNHYDGDGDVRVGELSIGAFNATTLRGKWHLLNNRLTFKEFNGKAYGGDMASAFSLVSAEAPAIASNFRFTRIDSNKFFNELFNVDAIGGVATLNGQVKTGGIHFESWMNNLRGGINLVGSNIKVSGVNMDAVSRQIRRKPDIRTLTPMMPELYGNGSTLFDKIEFSGTLSNGRLETDKWIASARSSIAKLTGEFSFSDFVAKIRMEAKLVALGRSAPDLIVLNEGPPSALKVRFDTSSVERYISRK